jgi:hypothetical protein
MNMDEPPKMAAVEIHEPASPEKITDNLSGSQHNSPLGRGVTTVNAQDVIMQMKHSDADLVIPLWMPVLIMLTYVMVGGAFFKHLEQWETYMSGCYFCFVTLTTIGLGDFVPGNAFQSPTHMLILCITYVFFGLALIAMCFDLVQHEVRMKFRSLGYRLGFIKPKVKIIDPLNAKNNHIE